MTHRELVREFAPRRGRRVGRAVAGGAALAAVLAGGTTTRGAAFVLWLRAFLEFFSGVFALVALTAAVVVGLAAAGRFTPIRLRVLAQGAHRATALMSMSFLAAHVLLKVLERHAPVVAAVLPFYGVHGRTVWVGLGTIAGDLMALVFAAGVARGRFIGGVRGWTWRAVHISAYLCWPIAIAHGLKAGRVPKEWVTLSYLICLGLVAVVALARLVSSIRRRGKARPRPVPAEDDPAGEPLDEPGVPDERFWAELKAEAAQWTGGRR